MDMPTLLTNLLELNPKHPSRKPCCLYGRNVVRRAVSLRRCAISASSAGRLCLCLSLHNPGPNELECINLPLLLPLEQLLLFLCPCIGLDPAVAGSFPSLLLLCTVSKSFMNPHLLELALPELDEDEFEDDDREVDAEARSKFVLSGTIFKFGSASDFDFGFGLREADCVWGVGPRVGDMERVRRWMGADARSTEAKPVRIWPLRNSSSAELISGAARLNSKSSCARSAAAMEERVEVAGEDERRKWVGLAGALEDSACMIDASLKS